jgi:hypothetical protein
MTLFYWFADFFYYKTGFFPDILYLSLTSPVPEFIDPVFAKTSPKRLFSVIENEHFGLVFAKTGSINSGMGGNFYRE